MKKLISILLTALIASSAAVCASAATDTSLYRSKLGALIDASPYSGDYVGTGFFYDFDGNGVKELVTYSSVKGDVVSKKVMNVYTIKNGKAKAIVKNKKLFLEVGGPNGFTGVAKKGKTKYVICGGETGSTGGAPDDKLNRYGSITLYKIKGAKVVKKIKASFNVTFKSKTKGIKVLKCKAKVNGKKKSYKAFSKWLRSYKVSKVSKYKRGLFGVTYYSKGTSLNSLYSSL